MVKLSIAIASIVLLLVAACSSNSDDFEAEPVSRPDPTPSTTAAPEIQSCDEAAAELRLQLWLDSLDDDDPDTNYVYEETAREIVHDIVADGVRACSIQLEVTVESDNQFLDGNSDRITGMLCINAETWYWMGERERRIVEELEDCQILLAAG